ncbi:hypothetical protein [Caproiciproducens sp.]|uniref:hypothetical protein n=1 Tax=Caproiciproducens sp. TaxID=1954376 RepID=UPI0028A0E339|nr:hypothetical protein [Caproiciproducens sp.]
MKVGTSAVPTLPYPIRSIGSRLKRRTNLQWPHITLGIGGREGRVLLPAPAVFHNITLLQAGIQKYFSVKL